MKYSVRYIIEKKNPESFSAMHLEQTEYRAEHRHMSPRCITKQIAGHVC
jgi:hypothetical protein